MPTSRPNPSSPFAQLRSGEFIVSLGSTTLAPGSSANLSRIFEPEGASTPDTPSSATADPGPVTYRAAPDDNTEDGNQLALMNDLMHALPGGARTVIWFDDRPPEVQHHDPTTPADDLVTLSGYPPATTPRLAALVAAALNKEGG